MAKLILSLDGSIIKEVPLDKERMTIGRKSHNDIQIDNLAVSGEHALIVTILNDSFLEDLGSTNGTLVNGNPIKKHILQNNDTIEIGKYKLKYAVEGSAAAAGGPGPADFEKTMVIRPGMATRAAEAGAMKAAMDTQSKIPPVGAMAPPAPAARATTAPQAVAAPAATPAAAAQTLNQQPAPAPVQHAAVVGAIQILSGASAGKELELTKNLTTLGKPGIQVAVITRRPQGYFITHVEGTQLPIVNGKTLDAQAHALSDHDVIELAGVKMEFFIKS
jgi:pSer/pThr/pTyr-binding forkhead associated (FHA) protein